MKKHKMGGAERLTMALAERMTARGHQVLAVVLKGPHGGDLKCPVEVVHLGMEQRPASAVSGAARAMWLLRGFGPDVIHSHGFQANMLARLVGATGAAMPDTGPVANPPVTPTPSPLKAALIEAGWPGERMLLRAGATRVYTAIASLHASQ